MIDQRYAYCPRCDRRALHNRYHWAGLWAVQMFFILGSACWLCLPVVLPVGLLIYLIDSVRPHHCVTCGRLWWRFPKDKPSPPSGQS